MSPAMRKPLVVSLCLMVSSLLLAQMPPDPLERVAALAGLRAAEVQGALKAAFPKGTNIQQRAGDGSWSVQTQEYRLEVHLSGDRVVEVTVTFVKPVAERGLLRRLGFSEAATTARPPQALRWERAVSGAELIAARTVGSTAPNVIQVTVVPDRARWDDWKLKRLR